MNPWEFNDAIQQSAMKRIVEDGNLLQSLISKLDLELGTGERKAVDDTISCIGVALSQLDANCTALQNILDIKK